MITGTVHYQRLHHSDGQPESCADAVGWSAEQGLAVIADGVSTAPYSADWAARLTREVLADPPPHGRDELAAWLRPRQRAMHETLAARVNGQPEEYVRRALESGAATTLLFARAVAGAPGLTLDVTSLGDCNLFLFGPRGLVTAWPWTDPSDFGRRPAQIQSVPGTLDGLQQTRLAAAPGTSLVLATDAVAGWLLRYLAGEDGATWSAWASRLASEAAWAAWVRAERAAGRLKNDDSTALVWHFEGPAPRPERLRSRLLGQAVTRVQLGPEELPPRQQVDYHAGLAALNEPVKRSVCWGLLRHWLADQRFDLAPAADRQVVVEPAAAGWLSLRWLEQAYGEPLGPVLERAWLANDPATGVARTAIAGWYQATGARNACAPEPARRHLMAALCVIYVADQAARRGGSRAPAAKAERRE